MLNTTREAIKSVLRCDQTITPDQIEAGIRALEGKGAGTLVSTKPIPRILTREEVAELCHKSVKTIDLWGRRGVITRVTTAGASRSSGYSEDSVRKMLEGKTATREIDRDAR